MKSKILIAEDDKNIGKLISVTLKSEGYEPFHAINGFEALMFIEKNIPDLVITDVMMPEFDGLSLIKAIRNREETKNVPVIIVSAKSSSEDILSGLDHGARFYLSKPFKLNELIAQVKYLLPSKQL